VSRSIVKSAARALEVLEYFATRRSPATVGEICSALELPQSSTSVLLKTLLKLGYLDYIRDGRRYFPTAKVAALGNWVTAAPAAPSSPPHFSIDDLSGPRSAHVA
jgi:DNA-binding IclR family transcriptional regulator